MQTVLLLFGGESTEHEVSIVSATNVNRSIDTNKYSIIYVFIDHVGKWWKVPGIVKSVPDGSVQLLPRMGEASFQVVGSDEVVRPDVIFPILHGRNGEDGSVQALAQLLHIPVVGCDMTSSAAAMNKYLTKQVAIANDLQVAPFGIHHVGNPVPVFEKVSEVLGTKLFIKPANAGSSVGVHKVQTQDELAAALEDAHRYDDIVLMEKSINARELEVAVLGNYPDIQASVVGEITPDGDFYSYESKYDSSSTSMVTIPAEISPEISDRIREQSQRIFQALGCSGMARVDFFIDKDTAEIYLNEVNTIPGFTDISMYPKLWEHAGVNYGELVDRLITLAVQTNPAQ